MHEAEVKRSDADPDAQTGALAEALKAKTALLHEVDHRVKNNLQLISSLLLLQARRTDDPAVSSALRNAQSRVNAVATVHRRLFQGDDLEHFDLADFIRDLAEDAITASGRRDIAIRLDLRPAQVPANKAAPLALLISELLGNAIRHAFPDERAGEIAIVLAPQGDFLRIEIADNGVGVSATESSTGFGQTIVRLLCGQLRADWETTDAHPGVRTVIWLPADGKT